MLSVLALNLDEVVGEVSFFEVGEGPMFEDPMFGFGEAPMFGGESFMNDVDFGEEPGFGDAQFGVDDFGEDVFMPLDYGEAFFPDFGDDDELFGAAGLWEADGFKRVKLGTCEGAGMIPIMDKATCQAAAKALGHTKRVVVRPDTSWDRVKGCTLTGDGSDNVELFANAKGSCGTYNYHCVCQEDITFKKIEYGRCREYGMKAITDKRTCEKAASKVYGKTSDTVRVYSNVRAWGRPFGCTNHMHNERKGAVRPEFFPNSKGSCGVFGFKCLCMSTRRRRVEQFPSLTHEALGAEDDERNRFA